ncbi:TPA: DUF4435 domain-containing protein [Vibrio vulnificus]|nr:DUF4435 domain-containing protein [Vibrio vulnificus]
MSALPVWSSNATKSIGLLYRDLQEIEIYVEDADSEVLYRKLLSRAVSNVKIRKVIPLYGRQNVIDRCKDYAEEFPALFIIDGDLDLLHGSRISNVTKLFQHRLYCMENYLFCKDAGIEILQDSSGKISPLQAEETLQWDNFLESISQPLIDLFIVYGIVWKVFPQEKTVARSYHKLTKQVTKRRGPELCSEKVMEAISELKKIALTQITEQEYQALQEEISQEISGLENKLYAVSAKDYLLKAYRDYLAYKGASNLPFDESFKFRLARYCNTDTLAELSKAIVATASGKEYVQAA